MNILSEIITKKRERVLASKASVPVEQIQDLAGKVRSEATTHALSNALQGDGIHVIAEFKRRSPSKGIIRPDADLVQIGRIKPDIERFLGRLIHIKSGK